LSVAAVNDPPTFKIVPGDLSAADENPATKGPALLQSIKAWATNLSAGPPDEAGQSLNFTVANDNPSLFAVQPAVGTDGTLTYMPLPNAHGIAHVTVLLHDTGGGTNLSAPASFNIEIKKTHPLHNATEIGMRNGLDVTGSTTSTPDGVISASDVVAIINYINAHPGGSAQTNSAAGPPYCDVTDDDQVGADDVIAIINYLNAHPDQAKASEHLAAATTAVAATSGDNEAVMGINGNGDSVPQPIGGAPSATIQPELLTILATDAAPAQLKRRLVAG